MTTVPAPLKPITSYIRRAEELDKAGDPKFATIAHYCRTYAMELGIKLNDKSPEVQQFLGDLMKKLEEDKKHLAKDKEAARKLCEEFAISVFARADKEDRAGKADKNTARTFYSAGTYFEILKQFSPTRDLDQNIKDKALYAKWKATDILQAIKEGRKPKAGPPGGDEDEAEEGKSGSADTTSNGQNSGSSSSGGNNGKSQTQSEEDYAPGSSEALQRQADILASQAKQSNSTSSSTSSSASGSGSGSASASGKRGSVGGAGNASASSSHLGEPLKALPKETRDEAIDLARFTIKALETDEIELAISRLNAILGMLHQPS